VCVCVCVVTGRVDIIPAGTCINIRWVHSICIFIHTYNPYYARHKSDFNRQTYDRGQKVRSIITIVLFNIGIPYSIFLLTRYNICKLILISYLNIEGIICCFFIANHVFNYKSQKVQHPFNHFYFCALHSSHMRNTLLGNITIIENKKHNLFVFKFI